MTTELTLSTDKIQAHIDGASGHVIFNNPERHNAVSLEMWDAVESALSTFAEDDQVRVARALSRVPIFQSLKKNGAPKKQPNTTTLA